MTTPMSDAELDDTVKTLNAAITQLRAALAHSQREHQITADTANGLAEEIESLQRRDTERDAELAAAVADNAVLLDRVRKDARIVTRTTAAGRHVECGICGGAWLCPHGQDELPQQHASDCIAFTAHPGAELLREHERRGAEIERLQAIEREARKYVGADYLQGSDLALCAALDAYDNALAALDAGDEGKP